MSEAEFTRVVVRDFKGLDVTTDPFDMDTGNFTVMENVGAYDRGILQVRLAVETEQNLSTGLDSMAAYSYHHPSGDYLITVTESGQLRATTQDGQNIILMENLPTDTQWSFAQSRKCELIGVYGQGQRGIWWDGNLGRTAFPIGIEAPATNATVTNAAGGGASEGLYQYGVRFIQQHFTLDENNNVVFTGDETDSSLGPSDFITVNAGDQFEWTDIPQPVAPDDARVTHIQLWRSLADSPNVLYLIATEPVGTTTFTDTFTDQELFDNAIDDISTSLPIIAGLNTVIARRQGVPPSEKAVVTIFQDRAFYLVNRELECTPDINSMFYSFPDEVESVFTEYDENGKLITADQITRQINTNDPDSMVAAVPFGAILYVFSDRHVYSFDYSVDPGTDGNMRWLAHRGLVGQNAWDIMDDTFFAIDRAGVYMMSRGGGIRHLSDPLEHMFRDDTFDWSTKNLWHVMSVRLINIVRFFVTFTEDVDPDDPATQYPKRALCYNLEQDAWFMEIYPEPILRALHFESSDDRFQVLLVTPSGYALKYTLDSFQDEVNGTITPVHYRFHTRPFRFLQVHQNAAANMENVRALRVIHRPNMQETVTVRQYFNRDTNPTPWGIDRELELVSTTRANPDATVNLDDQEAYWMIAISSLREVRARGEQWVSFELEGDQTNQLVFYNELQVLGTAR